MTGTPKRLCQKLLTATPQVIYTAVSDGKTVMLDIMACNIGSNQRSYSLYINGTADSNYLLHHSNLASNNYEHIGQMYQILNAGESLYAVASDVNSIVLTISGLERI